MKTTLRSFFKSIRFEYKISIVYLFVGLLWIFFSDILLGTSVSDPQSITQYQSFKGSIYILVTAILLFYLVRAHIRKIKEQQFLFETMFNTIPDSVVISNTKREIILVNKSTLEAFGYKKEELIKKPIEILYEDNVSLHKAGADGSKEDQQNGSNNVFINFKGKHKNLFPGEVFTARLYDSAGTWIGNLDIICNVSERVKFISEIEEARRRAEESDRLKTAFLQNISHEIRTPMNAIIGFSEMLSKLDLTAEKQNRYKEIIVSSGYQLLSIVTDILTISVLESKQAKITISPVDVNSVLRELHSVFAQIAEKNKISLTLDGAYDSGFYVNTDETKLRQILTNLLSNAVKFTVRGKVEFGYERTDTFIQFHVKDSGIGIDSGLHEKIFERFRQADLEISRNYGGTGLGLSISKEFIELLGGKIWLESEKGKGATFYFTIPANLAEPAFNNQPLVLPKLNKPVILIAEDEELNYLFVEELLSGLNVTMIHARNGKEAVDLYRQHPEISLVIMDLKMPVMNGYEATKLLKQSNPQLPVVALTAYALPHEIENAKDYGFDAYLTKPVRLDQLTDLIRKYFGSDGD
jgi:PAS domain S-box-containing protein